MKLEAQDLKPLKYVGGPRHGLRLEHSPWYGKWPPRKVRVTEFHKFDPTGLYVLRGAELHWIVPSKSGN